MDFYKSLAGFPLILTLASQPLSIAWISPHGSRGNSSLEGWFTTPHVGVYCKTWLIDADSDLPYSSSNSLVMKQTVLGGRSENL